MVNLIRIKLVNFVGIYLGIGVKELEIDRSKSNNNIILLLGNNGSGKSSLLAEMTPFPLEHLGSRNKSRILKDENGKQLLGIKELDYLVDNFILYKIKIVYDPVKSTKCFITKYIDGKEIDLNPNGNVESYIEIIENELHIKKNYTNVGYLCGSGNSKNFISMTPTERNSYISEWMPEIAEFLDAFKLSSKILSKFKKDIENYNKQIGNMSSINYELELNFLNSNIENISKQLKEVESKIVQLNTYQDQILPNVKDMKYISDCITKFKQYTEKHKKYFYELQDKYKDLSTIDFDDNIGEKALELENKLSKLHNDLTHTEETIAILTSEISSNTSLLNNDEKISELDLNTIYETIFRNKDLISSIEKSIEEFGEKYNISDKNLIDFNNKYNDYTNFLQKLDAQFLYLNNFISLDSIQSMNNFEESISNKEKRLQTIIEMYNKSFENLTFINNEIYKYEHGNLDTNILVKRPDFCKSHSCGVIEELMKYLNPKDNLKDLYERSKETNEEVNKLKEEKELITNRLNDYNKGLAYYKEIINFLYKNNELISQMPDELVEYFIKEPSLIYIKMNEIKLIMDELYEYSSLILKHNEITNSIKELDQLKCLVTNNSKIQAKLDDLNSKYEIAMKNKNIIMDNIEELSKRLDIYTNAKDIIRQRDEEYNKYNEITENLNKWKNVLHIWNKSTYVYNSNKNYIENTLMNNKTELENELMNLNKKRDEMTTFFISKRQIEKMRNEIQDKFNRVNILNKIWSPKVGYPSWKIEKFLNDLTIKTNEDMKSMWGSDLKIKEFKLDATDFSIVMEKDGVEIKDASLCSQGERETINAAISFSIIESNIENDGYDVLRLDEVDGPLDERRRIGFIDMIQKRVDEMNCDSCFIITHNGEFEDIPCDIILLNGAKVPEMKLKNKNILFRYQGDQ